MWTKKSEGTSTTKATFGHPQELSQWTHSISMFTSPMMPFRPDHQTMGNLSKETKFHGKNSKNGWKKRDIINSGRVMWTIIKGFAEIYWRVWEILLPRSILSTIHSIYSRFKRKYPYFKWKNQFLWNKTTKFPQARKIKYTLKSSV